MKIQTNTGDVVLTAEMVVRGMVLADAEGDVAVLMDRFVGYECMWSVKGWAADESTPPLAPCWVACLGCEPAVASRADCEHYGVHGDAAAHGFARLRGGGAVDFRRVPMPVGAIARGRDEERIVLTLTPHGDRVLGSGEQFAGLDGRRHASPADVERLCCGARNEVLRSNVCTLAIGDHAEHEDIATGAKWPAKPMAFHDGPTSGGEMRFSCGGESFTVPYARGETTDTIAERVRRAVEDARPPPANGIRATGHGWDTLPMAPCAKCGAPVGSIMNAMSVVLPEAGRDDWRATASVCKPCSAVVEAGRGLYEIREGWIVEKATEIAPRFLYVQDTAFPVTAKRTGDAWEVQGKGAELYHAFAAGKGPWTLTAADGTNMRRCFLRDASIISDAWTPTTIVTATLMEERAVLFGVDLAAGPSTSAVHVLTARGKAGAMEVQDAKRDGCPSCGGSRCFSCSQVAGAFCRFIGGLKRWSASPEGQRVQREAPMLALVAAVPEGLNPIGWRAAVLAVDEMCKVTRHVSTVAWKEAECEEHLRAFAESRTVPEDVEWGWGMQSFAAVDAYRRAIAPHRAPPPERKRGPRLPIDDGGHYE